MSFAGSNGYHGQATVIRDNKKVENPIKIKDVHVTTQSYLPGAQYFGSRIC